MSLPRIIWRAQDEIENVRLFDVSFGPAVEVIENESSVKVSNIGGDAAYIGPTNDLKSILYVYVVLNEGFRVIQYARRATPKEIDSYFLMLRGGK